jgi:small subunit ribosomal protein S1
MLNSAHQDKESFAQLLESFMQGKSSFEGQVVKGTIVSIKNGIAVIDIGLKSEGKVPLKDLEGRVSQSEIAVGDKVDVYVERLEDRHGDAVLSIEKAKREAAWIDLEKAQVDGTLVNGVIFGRVKGGFAVDLDGAVAFLPGSQVDVRPIKDINPLMNIVQPFKVLKMDKIRSNIVVSRRAVLEDSRAEAKSELIANLSNGQVLSGIVKNITDYGAFVDLGGVDGLLHVTDISWKRINHPSEVLTVGETVQVQVVKYNKDTKRISLGMKQLEEDPWQGLDTKYVVGSKIIGKVVNIADYGAFVELEPAIEGLIHLSEMSWIKKNLHPNKILSIGQEVEVAVLEVDITKRRISLGLKQCQSNPWEKILEDHPVGSTMEGVIKNITEFGLFVGVNDQLDGMVHLSDLSWDQAGEDAVKNYSKGQTIAVKILDIDVNKERISLGVKQLTEDSFAKDVESVQKGSVVTCSVVEIEEKGIKVSLSNGLEGYIKKVDLSKERSEQRTDRFATGEKIDAKVVQIDKNNRVVALSIKAKEVEEEKKVLSEYGSSDSGASLGDILGAAMDKAKKNSTEKKTSAKADNDEEEKTAKKISKPRAKKED